MKDQQILAVDDVSKRFGVVEALKRVSFGIHPGEIFGLIGVNGAGKTSLIKAILQLHRADTGSIQIGGMDAELAESRRQLCYLPEKFSPSPLLTGVEFLRLTVSAYGMRLELAEAEALAARLRLDPAALGRRIRGYSKGMAQKLGLMGAMLSQRPLLLLDEPMSGLDPGARMVLRDALLAYRQEKPARSIFFSTHLLADVEALCDRIGVMHGGVLHYLGDVKGFLAIHGKKGGLDAAYMRFLAEMPLPILKPEAIAAE